MAIGYEDRSVFLALYNATQPNLKKDTLQRYLRRIQEGVTPRNPAVREAVKLYRELSDPFEPATYANSVTLESLTSKILCRWGYGEVRRPNSTYLIGNETDSPHATFVDAGKEVTTSFDFYNKTAIETIERGNRGFERKQNAKDKVAEDTALEFFYCEKIEATMLQAGEEIVSFNPFTGENEVTTFNPANRLDQPPYRIKDYGIVIMLWT